FGHALDETGGHFTLSGTGRLHAGIHLGQASLQQLLGPGRGHGHELERVGQLTAVHDIGRHGASLSAHWARLIYGRTAGTAPNVSRMRSAAACMRGRRTRSACTMHCMAITHASRSSLMTT